MKYYLILLLTITSCRLFSQQQTFDIVNFTAPKVWTKQTSESSVQFSKEDAATGNYCIIMLLKSVPGTSESKTNFDAAWETVVKEMVTVSTAPEMQPPVTENGWEAQTGYAPFESDGTKGVVMLVTSTGFEKMVNIMIMTNSDVYEKDITDFLESISFKKITETGEKPVDNTITPPVSNVVAKKDGFTFTTTNFDDGWNSTVQEDWVEVTKGNIKALLHYSFERNTASSDPDPITNDAWNILVAPRYSNLKNYVVKYVSDYDRVHLAAGNLTDNTSGTEVYVVFISRSGNVWIEFISPDKNAFVQAFGIDFDEVAWNSDKAIFEPLLKLANCNKFAVAASDLTGKWSSNSSSVQQYYNRYTGDNAGMNLSTANETFQFGVGNTYQWDFVWVNGFSGREKVVQDKFSGKFSVPNNWQVNFSKIYSGPKTYDAYFTCIKGGRILWMNDAKSPGSGIFKGYGKEK
ncbi:MAG: hypothetical protein SGI83_13540 [Bacteroidota bacterium]|nr:hypothetical protein [Bacteroidota bacterium]